MQDARALDRSWDCSLDRLLVARCGCVGHQWLRERYAPDRGLAAGCTKKSERRVIIVGVSETATTCGIAVCSAL